LERIYILRFANALGVPATLGKASFFYRDLQNILGVFETLGKASFLLRFAKPVDIYILGVFSRARWAA